MTENVEQKFAAFRDLHLRDGTFIMPNAWDAGSARILTSLGFEALATTSAGYAFSIGQRDSFAALTRDQILSNGQAIVEATGLPVSADLEDGFGAAPEACAKTIRAAADVGLVGGSIEDTTGDPERPIYDFQQAVERVAAAAEAAKGLPFLLTARAENYICGRLDFDDTLRRLQAFANAGADVLYAPGLPDLNAVKAVCMSLDKPVNVLAGLTSQPFTLLELQEASVKRISVGGSFARTALGAFIRAAKEVRDQGTFTFSASAIPDQDITAFMSPSKRQSD